MFLRYVLRNLLARRGTVLPALLAIVSAVGATVVVLSMLEGLLGAIEQSGQPDSVIVMTDGANDEPESKIDKNTSNQVKVAPGIAKAGEKELLAEEFVTTHRARRADGTVGNVRMRGIDPISPKLHEVEVVGGSVPTPGQSGVLIGEKQLGKFEGFQVGGSLKVGAQSWPVVGVVHAPNSVFDSEIWADRLALSAAIKREGVSSIRVKLDGPQRLDEFKASVARIPDQRLMVLPEIEFYRSRTREVSAFVQAGAVIVLILLLGAVLTAINIMYTLFLGRLRELCTLMTIGYRRSRIAFLQLQESLMIAFVGGAIGVALGRFVIHGRLMSFEELHLQYSANTSPRVLASAVVMAAAIGIVGSTITLLKALRMDVLECLRTF
jgi:putative ABC transport system permease protein